MGIMEIPFAVDCGGPGRHTNTVQWKSALAVIGGCRSAASTACCGGAEFRERGRCEHFGLSPKLHSPAVGNPFLGNADYHSQVPDRILRKFMGAEQCPCGRTHWTCGVGPFFPFAFAISVLCPEPLPFLRSTSAYVGILRRDGPVYRIGQAGVWCRPGFFLAVSGLLSAFLVVHSAALAWGNILSSRREEYCLLSVAGSSAGHHAGGSPIGPDSTNHGEGAGLPAQCGCHGLA